MRSRSRVRAVAVMVLLVGVAFVQDPGYLVADTKFDLAVDPVRFLGRALHLWDDQGAFGQLQNQAYGYLWPMGPFFALLHGLDVPGWATQRLWQAFVMCVAFLGTARLARALGARSDLSVLVAGLAFALSPRMLTVLGPISIEAWPSALAPWVLLPLVRGSVSGSPRRAAALAALAVAMVGGVNAAATFAVLPLGVIWVLTRTRGPRRTALMVWWPVFTLLGTLWWLVPLFLMGAYSPPFLDYIETTTVTTFPTTIFDALRGTSNWVPYVSPESRSGNDLLITGYLALNSGLVLVAGFAGILDRRNPHRLFLALGVLVGLLMVTAGHVGAVQGLAAEPVKDLLDGVLAPLRNVHKFDVVIRLPLVLGLAFVLDRAMTALAEPPVGGRDVQQRLDRANRLVLVGVVLLGVVGASVPALRGRVEPSDPVTAVPQYWRDAADWLSRRQQDGTALLAPGSSFGTYLWGSPRDEPFQFLGGPAWAVRNAIPLAPPGNIRMLDAFEDRLSQGKGSPGLATFLRRSGVGYVVVRNDLRPRDDVPDPVLVHQALADSPGLTRVATFGPTVGGEPFILGDDIRTVINDGWQARYPAIEVYRVPGAGRSSTGSGPTVVAGGPEDLLDLADLGVIGDEPVVLGPDAVAADREGLTGPDGAAYVLTDGLRRRERFFPRLHDGASAVLTPGDVRRDDNPTRDFLDPDQERWSTSARLEGVRSLSASSSGSDANAAGGSDRGELPYAAVDGSTATAWASDAGTEGRAWWQVGLEDPDDLGQVTVVGGRGADDNQRVRVRTQNGVSAGVSAGPGESATVDLPAGETSWLRVESDSSDSRLLTLGEVSWPGRAVRRLLVLPSTPERWGDPAAVVLRADLDDRRGCVEVQDQVRCAPGRQRTEEEAVGMDRRFELQEAAELRAGLVVRPRAGPALDALVTRDQPLNVSASTTGVPDPRSSPLAAVDGDPATTWVARPGDLRASLSLSWIGSRTISSLSVVTARETAARRPTEVTLIWPGGRREVELDERGRASFAPIRTSQLRVQVEEAEFATGLDFEARQSQLGVGMTELRLGGLPYVPATFSTRSTDLGCGSGPDLVLDDVRFETAVTASPAELVTGEDLPARLCGTSTDTSGSDALVDLPAGPVDVSLRGSDAFDAVSLVLEDPARVTSGTSSVADTERSSPVARVVTPTPGSTLLDLGLNANPGWEAVQDGRALSPVVLDGWRQGWFLQDTTAVTARFAPDGSYRAGLGAGLLALLGLAGGVFLSGRRRVRGKVDPPSLATASFGVPAAAITVVAGVLLLASWGGLVVAAATAAAVLVLHRLLAEVVPWAVSGLLLVAAAGYFLHPWGDPDGWAGDAAWPAYLALVPVVAAVCVAVDRRPRSLRRIAGASRRR